MNNFSIAQLSLFEQKTQSYLEVPVIELNPHPSNPRPFSEKYQCNVDNDKVEELKHLITLNGYDATEPLKAYERQGKLTLVRGHHRWVACKELGIETIPCVIVELTETEAVIELMKNGKEVDSWGKAFHAFYCCGAYGSDGLMTISAYAHEFGVTVDTVSKWIIAQKVKENCSTTVEQFNLSVRACRDIGTLNEEDWVWVVQLCMDKKLGSDARDKVIKVIKEMRENNRQGVEGIIQSCFSAKTESALIAINAVKEIDIPPHFQEWLNPDKYIKKTISEALSGEIRTPRDVKNWVECAEKHYQGLDSQAKVILIVDDKESIEYRNLKEAFLLKLLKTVQGDKAPSQTKIEQLALEVRNEIDLLNAKYLQWIASKASDNAKKELEEQRKKEELEKRLKYSPTGYNDCVLTVLSQIDLTFDAIITDPPYLLSNDGITVRSGKQVSVNKNFEDSLEDGIHPKDYLPLFFNILKDGGYFVSTCTHHLRDILRPLAESIGFEFIQDLIWYKPNSTPLLTADRFQPDFEYISIYKKEGKSYFGYENIKVNDKQRGAVISIPQCGGKERLGWHDTQKPIELMELLIKAYVPVDGLILDPFSGSGTTAISSKNLNRICHWIEKKTDFFEKAQSRIESHKFSWE